MKSFLVAMTLLPVLAAGAQQVQPQAPRVSKVPPEKARPGAPEEMPSRPEKETPQLPEGAPEDLSHLKWDMAEKPPSVTHHQVTVNGKQLHYTATAGRMPIKDPAGGIDAEMFYVAYTLDGADAHKRPVTFAFNGGPGSASFWIHMGALGPRRVVLQKDGFMPEPPFRLADNPSTPLDRTDLVLIDAIGTGFSRPADMKKAKKFWGVKGDAQAFGEFIRLYLTRNQRWGSPLYLLGESYGTTRAAAVAGYMSDRGVAFQGIMLLSMVLDFETLQITRHNDLACVLTLPTYTMIAMYHHKLPADLEKDAARTRAEAEKWANTDYAYALSKGDALTDQERKDVIQKLARYTGLKPEVIDWANLRIDVGTFTHFLLADEKLRVGRLDGRYSGPDPEGFLNTRFYDPSMNAVSAPINSVFNDYVHTELKYDTDEPYYMSADQLFSSREMPFWRRWDWGSANNGFPETASALREAMVKDPYLKVMVMEGDYDLATPFAAAEYTLSHLDLPQQYRKNLSFATYDSGHMVYLRSDALAKFHGDVAKFIDGTLPH